MPPHRLDHAVDVLEELPRQAALADPGLAGDRVQAHAPLARVAVEQVLEQAELGIAADERRLEAVVAAAAPSLGHDAHRAPRLDGDDLPFIDVLARELVGERLGSGLVRPLPDHDQPERPPPGAARPY